MSLDTVAAQIESSQSNLNLYASMSLQDRITLNSTVCTDNSTGSCRGFYGEFDPSQFQTLDYNRGTLYNIAQREDCIKECQKNRHFSACKKICWLETRADYV